MGSHRDEGDLKGLIEQGRLREAAQVHEARGEAREAMGLFERACAFADASRCASLAGAYRDAVRLAALTARDDVVVVALEALQAHAPEQVAFEAAALAGRGQHRYAAWLYDRLEQYDEAAEAYRSAGLFLAAGLACIRAGAIAEGARVLERATQDAERSKADAARVSLGRLYAQHGKHDAAVRHLQQVQGDSEQRGAAVGLLIASLSALGLREALAPLEQERDRLQAFDPLDADEVGEQQSPEEGSGGRVAVTLFGRYDVLREVAQTPHARLLHACDRLTGQEVAIKWLASARSQQGRDALARFAREAEALASLNHPAIVDLRQYVVRGPAMVLEWMPGGSLKDVLERGAVSPARAVEIVRAVLSALSASHRMGILHRDVKPSNLLFDGLGAVHLADFGAAHVHSSEDTVTAAMIGTLAYMAPEQKRGEPAVVASDIFAVGVILSEMLTQRRFADKGCPSEVHPDLDEAHDALLRKMTADRPEDRFQDAVAAMEALEALWWSDVVVEAADGANAQRGVAVSMVKEGDEESEDRFAAVADSSPAFDGCVVKHDRWLKRRVWCVTASEGMRRRAAAFARAAHPCLPAIWGLSVAEEWIVVEPPLGTEARQLNLLEKQRLGDALKALHALGEPYGGIEHGGVWRHEGRVYLRFVPRHAEASLDGDLRQLRRFPAAQP